MASIIKVPAFTLPAGQQPVRDVFTGGAMTLRPWQKLGLKALRDEAWRILLAPTGSGKSMLIKALSVVDLAADPKRKAVIVVPQGIIAGSFKPVKVRVDSKAVAWSAGNVLIDTTESIAKLEAFLAAPATADLAGRIVVCTHQALVHAHQRVMAAHKGKGSPWKNVALYVDEAHHSRAAGEDDDGQSVASNQLGAVVAHYLAAKPGLLLLTTATWMRAQLDDIIPQGHEDDFTRYTHTLEEDLRSKTHLKKVSFRFLIGKVDDALSALYGEGNKKTIAYLPHVGSAQTKAAGSKQDLLVSYSKAIGIRVGGDTWTDMIQHKPSKGRAFQIRVMDFVNVVDRDQRKARLTSGIAMGGGKYTPDLLWALNLGKEGFDWPELQRAIVVGARGSIPEVLQMLGRVLRDYPGKAEVEFNVILPHDGGDMDASQVRDYMKMILASMVVEWPFKLPNLTPAAAREDRPKKRAATASLVERMDDPVEAVRVIEAVVDRALQGGGTEKDDAVIAGALKGLFPGATDDERGAAAERVKQMFTSRSKAMMANAADLPFDVEVTDGALGCVRALAMQIGHATLAELRESLGHYSDVTATEEETAAFCQGKSVDEYTKSKPIGMPWVSDFQRRYGKTYVELRDGKRAKNKISYTKEEVEMACQGKSCAEYDKTRSAGMPRSNTFGTRYGMTYIELRDGKRGTHAVTATEADVKSACQGKSTAQYDKERAPGMPMSHSFQARYGKTYVEFRDGKRARARHITLDATALRKALVSSNGLISVTAKALGMADSTLVRTMEAMGLRQWFADRFSHQRRKTMTPTKVAAILSGLRRGASREMAAKKAGTVGANIVKTMKRDPQFKADVEAAEAIGRGKKTASSKPAK